MDNHSNVTLNVNLYYIDIFDSTVHVVVLVLSNRRDNSAFYTSPTVHWESRKRSPTVHWESRKRSPTVHWESITTSPTVHWESRTRQKSPG